MITVREVVYSIYGAWRLAHLDPRGMAHFDTSLEGFWRSFFAAVIVAPAHVGLILLQEGGGTPDEDGLRRWLLRAITYVVGWTLWPLVMVHAAQAIDRKANYLRYIVAYNWSQVVAAVLLLAVNAIAVALLAPTAAGAAVFTTWMILLAYWWFVARTALAIPGLLAAGLVILDVILTLAILNLAAAIA